MSRAWKRWLVRMSGIAVVACAEPIAPTSSPPPVQLAFTMQPTSATAGVAIDPVVAVSIEDAYGVLVPSATNVVTVAIGTNSGGGTLTGTVSVAAVAGVATFSNLHLDKAGGYSLKAAAGTLTGATSRVFTIAAAAATRLAFTVQPSNAAGGVTITPPVQVAAQDSFGNRATGFADSVTVALADAPPGTLSGTTVVKASGGVATFRDLSIASPSFGYALTASAGGPTGASSVLFTIAKPTGWLHITAATSGGALDPDGYAACIDATPDGHGGTVCVYDGPLALGVEGSGMVAVDTGAHTVLLMGVAANCVVAGDNPLAVHAARAQTVAAPFAVACRQSALHVTTATTGVSLDADGYSLCVDYATDWESYAGCATDGAVGVNGAVTLSVASGTHVVGLNGVAPNCTVSGDNPRTVDVGDSTDVSFVITCVATGTVHVTTATTGTDLDQSYVVCFDPSGGGCSGYFGVGTNSTVDIPGVIAGPHTVSLTDVAGNCTVSGSTTRAVTVSQDGGTVDARFDVGCVMAERIAFSSGGTIAVILADGSDYSHGITAGFAPAWSPNGARLAFECGPDICAINADSTGFARLTLDAAANRHPAWSPDGLKIAFAATHDSATNLYVMAANGSGVTRLTQGVRFEGSPAWSPDGATIAFDCQVDAGNDDICSVNADGSGFVRLTSNPARDYGAAWKPDGSTLAFATTRYGGDEIALWNLASGSATRIGAGLPGFAPTWSPDGSHLVFVVNQGCDDWCIPYAIFVATADGAVVRLLAAGETPAWRPHP